MNFEKLCNNILTEMATPRDSDKVKTYYHGTSNIENAIGILTDNLIKPSTDTSKASLVPVVGNAYLAVNPYYAMIYAIGGIYMGHPSYKKFEGSSKWGALFEVDGSELYDIYPDEDAVGELLSDFFNHGIGPDKNYIHKNFNYKSLENEYLLNDIKVFVNIIKYEISPREMSKIKFGDMMSLARVGKKVLKSIYMNDKIKLAFIDLGAHIGHRGGVAPKRCWLIDKNRSKELKEDASNYREVCQEVSLDDLIKARDG